MRKVVSVAEMRALERAAESLGLPSAALMENAGRAVADAIGRSVDRPGRALVVVGPGNNGGDGLVATRHLHDAGWDVTVYYVNRPPVDDAKERLLRQRGIRVAQVSTDQDTAVLATLVTRSDVIVDAVFGTGRMRPIADDIARALDRVNAHPPSTQVIAVDVPSGVNADTGDADPHAIAATRTVTLGFAKRGLFVGPAATLIGELDVADIGLPADQASGITTSLADAGSIAWRRYWSHSSPTERRLRQTTDYPRAAQPP